MKKLILSLVAVAAAFSASAALTVTYDGKTIANGDVITVKSDGFVKDAPVPVLPFKGKIDFTVAGASTYNVVLNAPVEDIAICETGGTCAVAVQNGNEWVSTLSGVTVPGYDIEARLRGAELPQVKYTCSVVVTAGSETLSYTVVYDTTEAAGVAGVVADGVSFSALDGGLAYEVNSPVELRIFNNAGVEVLSQTVVGSGLVALDSFAPGIYFYSAAGVSGKILVK